MRAIQKQYEKKIRVNANKDTFTTYQRRSHHHSPIPLEKQRLEQEHNRIESLKSTLKSMSQQVSIELNKVPSRANEHPPTDRFPEELDHRKYNFKLDQLFKNLQQIAAKDYFSPASSISQRPKSSTINCTQQNRVEMDSFQKSQKLPQYYQPLRTETQLPRSSSNSLQFPASHSQSFIRKDDSLNSKSSSQNKSIQEHSKPSQQLIWSGKGEFKNSSSKKTFSKKDIICEPTGHNNHSKNLTKIFEKFEESIMDMPRMRERADTQFRQNFTSFNQNIHRGKITSILVSDHIYTSSLDYTIKKIIECDGEFTTQVVDKFRGGVDYVNLINGKVFGVGRDCYLRSVDGNFFHKFGSSPVRFFQSQRSNQINIGFNSGEVALFDLQKGVSVDCLVASRSVQMMSKWNKELFLGDASGLACVDWRKEDSIVVLFQSPAQTAQKPKQWMSNPFDKHFAYHCTNQILVLGSKFTKNYTYQIPAGQSFKGHDWGRSGINLLTVVEGTKTVRVSRVRGEKEKEKEEVDMEVNGQGLSLVVVRERQVIYGGTSGEIIIKRIKK